MPGVDEIAAAVDSATLTPVVRLALDDGAAELGGWTHEQLEVVSGLPRHRGLFRFRGTTGDGRPWSAVLKIVQRLPNASDEPSHSRFWRREQLAYQSGLLDTLAGITPVRCYVASESDGTLSFWLEDLSDEYDGPWPIERYGLAARHLGQMGGAFQAGRSLPDYDWLRRRAVGSGSASAATAIEAQIHDEATWRHPDVQRAYRRPIAERLQRQWADRRAFQAALAQQPLTLCHNDSHDENLFSRRRDDGTQETVAVDWELLGLGPLSGDITYLVIATLRRLAVDMEEADRLEEAVLEGYVAGLRDAGWRGEPADVRRGYTAAVALRLGLVPQTLDLILREERRAEVERGWHRPVEELIERWAAVAYFVLDRADTARKLVESP